MQGCSISVASVAFAVGISTMHEYVDAVTEAIKTYLQPIYMAPPTQQEIQLIRRGFALRRGLDCVAVAVDGTHIPYSPADSSNADTYRYYLSPVFFFIHALHYLLSDTCVICFVGIIKDGTVYLFWDSLRRSTHLCIVTLASPVKLATVRLVRSLIL